MMGREQENDPEVDAMKKLSVILIILIFVFTALSATAESPTPALTRVPTSAPTATPEELADMVTPEETRVLIKPLETPDRLAGQMDMQPGSKYLALEWGVAAFRGNASRQNAACGTIMKGTADHMAIQWDYRIAAEDGAAGQRFPWPGQPLIEKWSVEVRDLTRFSESFVPPAAMREVLVADRDGTIYFLDLVSGQESRGPLKTGYPMQGGIALHPSGIPYMSAGRTDWNGQAALRQFNLYDMSEMQPVDGTGGIGGILSSALIDRTTDVLIAGGMNGVLYKVDLNMDFDYRNGTVDVDPWVRAVKLSRDGAGFLAPVSALSDWIYCADTAGILRCVRSAAMKTEWEKDLGDAVVSAVALDSREDRTALYAANTLTHRKEGSAAVFCLDAQTGTEYWHREFPVEKQAGTQDGFCGFAASPVVGREELDGYVYYTVNGLSPEGRKDLGLAGTEDSALIAMDKETGVTAWACGISGSCVSSPVAVYGSNGGGRIIQCSPDGRIILLDGKQGTVLDELRVSGSVAMSPAVYRDMLVIASTGEDGAHIYGIGLETNSEENDQ